MKRFFFVSVFTGTAVIALSLGSFAKVFDANYKIADGSKLGKASCLICHTSKMGGKLNAYGEDLKKLVVASGKKVLTNDMLKKVEGLDSDKDGMKNVEEIKADRMPGVKD